MADFKNCKLWCTLQLLYSISFISKPGICSRLSQGLGFLSSKASYEENNKMNFFLKLSPKMFCLCCRADRTIQWQALMFIDINNFFLNKGLIDF